MLEVKEVLRLWLAGVPKQRIATRLSLDRKTVRRYLNQAQELGIDPSASPSLLGDELMGQLSARLTRGAGRPHGESWSECERHREWIAGKLAGGVKLSKVRRLLVREGIQISYATLNRFARAELGHGGPKVTVPVADGVPGEEVQLDTGWTLVLEPLELGGKRRRVRSWIFTAVVSRHRFVYPIERETTAGAIEACEAAWEFFGGVFWVVIPDNTKAIVDLADPLYPRINETFLEYSQSRGFQVDPTRARRPTDKPRVERAVQTVRDDCFGGERIFDLATARSRGRYWCLEEYGMRRHSTTQRLPREHFESEEKPRLLPLPTERYDVPIWASPKVARDHYAQVARSLYTLPTDHIGKVLRARADSKTVRFYDRGQLVKVHPRVEPGQRSTDENDFPAETRVYARRDSAFLQKQAFRHGESIGRMAERILDVRLPWTRMRRVYALLGLVKRYGPERVERACQEALAADLDNVKRLERMVKSTGPSWNAPPTPAKVLPLSRFLRPKETYGFPRPALRSEMTQNPELTKGECEHEYDRNDRS